MSGKCNALGCGHRSCREVHDLEAKNDELEKEVELYKNDGLVKSNLARLQHINQKIAEENSELRTRAAELEHQVNMCEGYNENWKEENKELQIRLSTLQKASEGMEKALEEAISEWDIYSHNESCGCSWYEEEQRKIAKAKQALADFRALKEIK